MAAVRDYRESARRPPFKPRPPSKWLPERAKDAEKIYTRCSTTAGAARCSNACAICHRRGCCLTVVPSYLACIVQKSRYDADVSPERTPPVRARHLHDCDEVEGAVLPQGELAARISGNATRHALRGPRQTEHRTPLLVGRGLHPLRTFQRQKQGVWCS